MASGVVFVESLWLENSFVFDSLPNTDHGRGFIELIGVFNTPLPATELIINHLVPTIFSQRKLTSLN
jgi:hypothetical protein